MDVRTQIRSHREASGLTKRALARRLGLHETFIYKLEQGEKDPSLKTLRDMATVFRAEGHPFAPELETLLGLAPTPTAA